MIVKCCCRLSLVGTLSVSVVIDFFVLTLHELIYNRFSRMLQSKDIFDDGTILGFWKIEETLDELLSMATPDLQR